MGTLDKDMLAIKSKPWLISLICAVFVIYPNAAWIFCDLSYLPRDEHTGFLVFFLFRFLYIWALIGLLVRYNLRHLSTPLFAKRLWINAALTLGGFAIYELLSHLAHSYDRFISILIFQFIVICLLCVFIGHIYLLYTYQREKEQEIERLRIENLQSRCDALAKQINPHFFFNSLNGISALIRKKNDERTLSYVTQLSDIFRYILQSDKKGLVTLDEELNFVEAFRHVMEVRYANKLCFRIDVPDARRDLRLPVLSLLPLLENVTVDKKGKIDFSDKSVTENTRVSYPIFHIDNIVKPVSKAPAAKKVIFLSADAFGVLPPVSILDPEQTKYYFLSGFTAKLAGTERGITEPTPTFSACFGAAFLSLHPTKYGEELVKRMQQSGAKAYLVNTGWNGSGKRISIKDTRAIIDAILDGSIDKAPTKKLPIFDFTIPTALPGVDPKILDPRDTYKEAKQWDEKAEDLAGRFIKNFQKFTGNEEGKKLVAAGPKLK